MNMIHETPAAWVYTIERRILTHKTHQSSTEVEVFDVYDLFKLVEFRFICIQKPYQTFIRLQTLLKLLRVSGFLFICLVKVQHQCHHIECLCIHEYFERNDY